MSKIRFVVDFSTDLFLLGRLALIIQDKSTPLHIASAKGHIEIVKFLLSEKADPDFQDKVGLSLFQSFFFFFWPTSLFQGQIHTPTSCVHEQKNGDD